MNSQSASIFFNAQRTDTEEPVEELIHKINRHQGLAYGCPLKIHRGEKKL